MLQDIFCVFLMLTAFTFLSNATTPPQSNETNLRAGQGKTINDLAEDSELQLLRADMQFIKAEIERLKKDILNKDADIRSLRSDNQLLRTDIITLKTELEKQKKSIPDLFDSQLLKTKQERQGHLMDGIAKNLDTLNSVFNTHNCTEAKFSGTYDIILPKFSSQRFKVACDAETQGGGWTVILRRMDGSVNFNRRWTEYKNGFGNLDGEFFMGLDKIHEITAERNQELLVLLEDFEGNKTFEKYEEFAIGNEDQQYKLHTLGDASGTAEDAFSYHRGSKFTTYDRDNVGQSNTNCAEKLTGGWWYRSDGNCQFCKLTGTYGNNDMDKGVTWDVFRGPRYSLKTAVMMIRPK